MRYYECTFAFRTDKPGAELTQIIRDVLPSVLGETGFDSFADVDDNLCGYIPEHLYDAQQVEAALQSFPLEGVYITHEALLMEDKNWNEEWERNYFQPVRIDSRCIIRASFHKEEPGYTYRIIIDPKMSFGTGNHETTLLMLITLLATDFSGKSVLDMGCGTGVLSILAAMKDAARVVAVDIDEWSYRNTVENAELNTVGIEVALGDASLIPTLGSFDIILANINRNILLSDISRYAPALNPQGLFIASGFYVDDLLAIVNECSINGMTYLSHTEKNRWTAAVFVRVVEADA